MENKPNKKDETPEGWAEMVEELAADLHRKSERLDADNAIISAIDDILANNT